MAGDYKKEYSKESESTDQLKIRIPKELHERFIIKLDGKPKSKWVKDRTREFVGDNPDDE